MSDYIKELSDLVESFHGDIENEDYVHFKSIIKDITTQIETMYTREEAFTIAQKVADEGLCCECENESSCTGLPPMTRCYRFRLRKKGTQ